MTDETIPEPASNERVTISVTERGTGRAIVFIHGWRLDGAVEAADIEPAFGRHDPWRRIYVDLPGMGNSPPDDRIRTLDDYLDAILGRIDELLGDAPFAVAGTSAGAALARGVAQLRRPRVRGLMLRVPMVEPGDAERAGGRHFNDDDERDAYFDSEPDDPWIPRTFLDAAADKRRRVWGPARRRAAAIGFVQPIRNDPSRYSFQRDFSDTVTVPTLIVAGRQDRRVGYVGAAASLDQYPRATLAVLDLASHVLPTGNRDLFDELVRDWLRRMEGAWGPDTAVRPRRIRRFRSWLWRHITAPLVPHGLYPSTRSRTPEKWFMLDESDDPASTRLLYEKTFETLSTFLDWRYKSMSLGFTVLAGAVALDEFLFLHTGNRWVLAAPLFVAGLFCGVVRKFDARNQTILNDTYEAGAELEMALGAASGGVMERIPKQRPLWTYHETIKVVFGWAFLLCMGAVAGAIGWGFYHAFSHHNPPHNKHHAAQHAVAGRGK